MGPGRSRFWLPLTRLGAFFVAVVVTGNIVFLILRPPSAAGPPDPDEAVDYFAKKKWRLERQLQRTLELFLGIPAAPKSKLGALPESPAPVVCIVSSSEVAAVPPIAAPHPEPRTQLLGYVEPELPSFAWPSPLSPMGRTAPDFPRSIDLLETPEFRAELVSEWYRRGAADPVADIGDALLKGPELLLDQVFTCANGMSPRREIRPWEEDENRSITAQLLDVSIGARTGRIFTEFLHQWADREQSYLSRFGESRSSSIGFDAGTEGVDLREFGWDQRKIFWDALRRTYVSRYKLQGEEKIRDGAWYFDRWQGADYAVLPPLLGAYIYYRGLDKRFSLGGSALQISIEPVSEWFRRRHDLAAAASLEWSMKGWPLGVIVSAGLHDGRYGMDFVGIGTSIGTARKAVVMQVEGERKP